MRYLNLCAAVLSNPERVMGTVCCCISKFATLSNIRSRPFFSSHFPSHHFPSTTTSINFSIASSSFSSATSSFTWDDVFRISESQSATQDRSRYLQGFSHKLQLCNRASVSSSHCFLCFLGKYKQWMNESNLVSWVTQLCVCASCSLFYHKVFFLFGFWNMGLANFKFLGHTWFDFILSLCCWHWNCL